MLVAAVGRTSWAIFEGTLRVELPWTSAFALGWRLLFLRIGEGGSSPDGRKRATEGRKSLLRLFELWWERELESQSLLLGLGFALDVGLREVLRRRFATANRARRGRTLAYSWGRRSAGADGHRRGFVVFVENMSGGRTGYGMGIKRRHWVTFKHRIRCRMFESVVSIGGGGEGGVGKRRGARVGVTRSRRTTTSGSYTPHTTHEN